MSELGAFDEVGQSDAAMYGPRGLLVCGMSGEEQTVIYKLIQASPMKDLPVIFAADDLLDYTLGEVLQKADGTGLGEASSVRRAVIMSGLTERELHGLMAAYRYLSLPRTLWAALTPISEGWSIRRLIDDLVAEEATLQAAPVNN